MTEILGELKTVREQVDNVLAFSEKARNNDFYLFWVWARRYLNLPLPYLSEEVFEALNGKTETVRRVRQKIQNEEGRWQPTLQTKVARVEREQGFHSNIRRL